MPQNINILKSNFTKGQLDPKLIARTDLKDYYSGAATITNWFINPEGGLVKRPGLRYIDTIKNQLTLEDNSSLISSVTTPNGGTGQDIIDGETFATTTAVGTIDDYVVFSAQLATRTSDIFFDVNNICTSYAPTITTALNNGGTEEDLYSTDPNDQFVTTNNLGSASGYPVFTLSFSPAIDYVKMNIVNIGLTDEDEVYNANGEFFLSYSTDNGANWTVTGEALQKLNASDFYSYVRSVTDVSSITDLRLIRVYDGDDIQTTISLDYISLSFVPDSDQEFKIQVSDDNVTWVDQGNEFYSVETSNTIDGVVYGTTYRRTISSDYDYVRVIRSGTTDLYAAVVEIGEIKIYSESTTLSDVKVEYFEFSSEDNYYLVFTDYNMAVYKNTVDSPDLTFEENIPSPYASDNIKGGDGTYLNVVTSYDTAICFNTSIQTYAFQRQGTDYNWQPFPFTFSSIPLYDFGDGAEEVYSDTKGWPAVGAIYQNRLWMGGSSELPNGLVASVTGNYQNLDIGSGLDDECIFTVLDSTSVPYIYNFYPGRNLQIFTSVAEMYCPLSNNEAMTPSNFYTISTTGRGSLEGVPNANIDGFTMFATRGGNAICQFYYDYDEDAYKSPEASVYSPNLIRTPVDLTARPSTSTSSANYILVVNTDGTLAVLTSLRDQDVNGWTLSTTSGYFRSCAASTDKMVFAIERTIDSTTSNFLEIFDDSLYVDCGSGETDLTSTVTGTTVDWLVGETVNIMADNLAQAPQVVPSGGDIEFSYSATDQWQVGLPLEPTMTTLPVSADLPNGTAMGLKKRVFEIVANLYETSSFYVNGYQVSLRQFGSSLLDQPMPLYTGEKYIYGSGTWDNLGQVTITSPDPLPCTLLGLTLKVSFGG